MRLQLFITFVNLETTVQWFLFTNLRNPAMMATHSRGFVLGSTFIKPWSSTNWDTAKFSLTCTLSCKLVRTSSMPRSMSSDDKERSDCLQMCSSNRPLFSNGRTWLHPTKDIPLFWGSACKTRQKIIHPKRLRTPLKWRSCSGNILCAIPGAYLQKFGQMSEHREMVQTQQLLT